MICEVYCHVNEQGGDPRINIEGTAKIVSAPYSYDDIYYSSDYIGTSTSDSDGKMIFKLVYGATVRISIPDIKLEKVIVVPSTATALLQDITEV